MADDLINDEAKEFLAELRIKIGRFGKRAQSGDLALFAIGIGWRQGCLGFVLTDRLRDAKPFRKHMDERRVDIVDALAVHRQNWISPGFISRRVGGRCGRLGLRFMRHAPATTQQLKACQALGHSPKARSDERRSNTHA